MFNGIRDWLLGSIAQGLLDVKSGQLQQTLQLARIEQKFPGLATFAVKLLEHQLEMERKIMDSQEQAAERVEAMSTKLEKVAKEVQTLKDAVNSGEVVSPRLVAAIERAENLLKGVDDINEDARTEPTEPAEPTDPEQPQG